MSEISDNYEAFPYPQIPLVAGVPREQVWQLHQGWLATQCGQPAVEKPKIWIAGCGTFQPYPFSQANPQAQILASDISHESLRLAQRRCRWHGNRNVTFHHLDLNDVTAYPNDQFDLIECYGVLMSVKDPAATLRAMVARLKPTGVLRLMVYPHYGRQRIFQIQKLVSALSLKPTQAKTLLSLMKSLPENHPLKATFFDYSDAKTTNGIVDGFFHPADRGFTGIEIASLADGAGLTLASCFHRPWGQPLQMEQNLGLTGFDSAFWLHYLDLWQSLKSNYILCFVPKAKAPSEAKLTRHDLFDPQAAKLGLRHRLRLLRMGVTGTQLQSRTHGKLLKVKGPQLKELARGNFPPHFDLMKVPPLFTSSPKETRMAPHWVYRDRGPNPMYAHLFDAYQAQGIWPELPCLKEQVARWRPYARPLEDEAISFGFTPWGTYPIAVKQAGGEAGLVLPKPIGEIRTTALSKEMEKFSQVTAFLKQEGVAPPEDPGALRELWILLFSYPYLFLNP